jgi:hypothetical protein
MTPSVKPTDAEIRRAVQVQHVLLASGDDDLWQQACSAEQDAARIWSEGRAIDAKAPVATAFGMIAQAGFLLRAIAQPEIRDDLVAHAQDTLSRAIAEGPEELEAK